MIPPLSDRLALAALNHLLAQAPWARRSAISLAGQPVRISLLNLHLDIEFDRDGWLCPAHSEPLTHMHLSPFQLVRLGAGDLHARHDVEIQGDTLLASQFGLILSNLSWDAEADLAGIVGDAPAHFISRAAHALIRWRLGGALDHARAWVEYASEESPTLAKRRHINEFIRAVDQIRDDVARLELRVDRLARRVPPPAA